MLAMITYVDNLDRCHYDIPFNIYNWFGEDRQVLIYSGSDATTEILKEKLKLYNLKIIQIPVSIKSPGSIPVAFDYAVDHAFITYGFDAVCLTHADVYMTKAGVEKIVEGYKKGWNTQISHDAIQLYAFLWTNYPHIIMSHHDKVTHWDRTSDGGPTVGFGPDIIYHYNDHENPHLALDNGYFTVEQYMNKMYSHNFLWPDPFKVQVRKTFMRDISDGVRMVYHKIRQTNYGTKLAPIVEERYKELLDHNNCWDEYHMCMDILEEVNDAY